MKARIRKEPWGPFTPRKREGLVFNDLYEKVEKNLVSFGDDSKLDGIARRQIKIQIVLIG